MLATTPAPIPPDLLTAALIGFHRAFNRLKADAAASPRDDDGMTALTSATECLFWACAIEDVASKYDPTYGTDADSYGRSLVQGARWARNQGTHQLAFVVAKAADDGEAVPEVVWRPATDLPVPEHESKGQRKKYDLHLADQPVMRTFSHIAGFFASEQNRAGSLLKSATRGLGELRDLGGE